MKNNITQQFMEALHKLESARNVEDIVQLFADNCEIGNVVTPKNLNGKQGAQEFWRNYRDTFGEVQSDFRNQISTNGTTALEWTTRGTVRDGQAINYEGVSILETKNGKITRFYAYFDPNHLGHQVRGTNK